MNIKIITSLIMLASLVGCASKEININQTNMAPTEIIEKIVNDIPLTDKELDVLAKTTTFTVAQLKEVGVKLGYKCILTPELGSHVKKRICSTEQQRKSHAAAAKKYTNKILISHHHR
jgi:hypothetical protein